MAEEGVRLLAPKEIDVGGIVESNGSGNVTISNVAPAGVGTATISRWMKVIVAGTTYYIPMWT